MGDENLPNKDEVLELLPENWRYENLTNGHIFYLKSEDKKWRDMEILIESPYVDSIIITVKKPNHLKNGVMETWEQSGYIPPEEWDIWLEHNVL